MDLIHTDPDRNITLFHGDSYQYTDDVGLIFTNPYAPLPRHFYNKPMIICDFTNRHKLAEERCGTKLKLVSKWYNGINSIWIGNIDVAPVDLSDLNPDMPEGWFPQDLVVRLFSAYLHANGNHKPIVWDGFMGRGTVGRIAKVIGLPFVGIDKDLKRVQLAKDYIYS